MGDELLRALVRDHRRAEREADSAMTQASDTSADADLFRPLGTDERAAVLDAAFERIDAAETPTKTRQRGPLLAFVGMTLAIAAVLVLWIARPGGESAVRLPSYTVTTLRGGASEVRADPGAVDRTLELVGDGSIEVVITPARSVEGELAVTLVAENAEGRRVFAAVDGAEITESGAVRLKGPLSRFVRLEPGDWKVAAVVSPADHRPKDADTALTDETLQRATFRVKLAPSP